MAVQSCRYSVLSTSFHSFSCCNNGALLCCSKITFELDRRFWALDHDQSMSLLHLYDEGRR